VTVIKVQMIHLPSSRVELIFTLYNKVFIKSHLYFF